MQISYLRRGLPTNGYISSDGKTIVIDANAEQPYQTVLAHEAIHEVQRAEGEAASMLRELISPTNEQLDQHGKNLNAIRKKQGFRDLSRMEVEEEYGAEFGAARVLDPKFWDRALENPGQMPAAPENPGQDPEADWPGADVSARYAAVDKRPGCI